MSKSVARPRRKGSIKPKRKSRPRLILIICLLLTMVSAAGSMAWWRMRPGTPQPAPPQQSNFNANSPSKEYIYAGGRLIATEEPVSITPPPAPTTFLAASEYSPMKVHLTWDAVAAPSFDHYRVERRSAGEGFTAVNSNVANTAGSFDDSQVDVDKAYLYRICAVTGSLSTCSEPDLTTTVELQDYPFLAGSLPVIRAQHFLDLMAAVNAVRKLAWPSEPPITWSPQHPAPAAGGVIYASHFNDLRNGLKGALSELGLTGSRYALPAQVAPNDYVSAAPMQRLHEIVK